MDPNNPNPISPLPNFTPQPVVATTVAPVVPAASVVEAINPDLVGDVSPSVLSAPFVPSITTPVMAPVIPEAVPTIDPIVAPVVVAPIAPVAVAPSVASPLVENPDDVKTIS